MCRNYRYQQAAIFKAKNEHEGCEFFAVYETEARSVSSDLTTIIVVDGAYADSFVVHRYGELEHEQRVRLTMDVARAFGVRRRDLVRC